MLFDFHNYFDGLIGLEDLQKFGFSINFPNHSLDNTQISLPIYFRQASDNEIHYTLNAHEVIQAKIPVNTDSGSIYIQQKYQRSCKIPCIVTNAENGYALVELHNTSEHPTTAIFSQPVLCDSADQYNFYDYNLNLATNCPTDLPRTKQIETMLRSDHLNPEEKRELITLCKQYTDVFHFPDDKLTFTNQVKHKILTKDEEPVYTKSYRYPHVHKTEVQKQIQQMLDDEIIRPSCSPWSSPIWIVPKKLDASGKQKWRIVIDYRKVNEKRLTTDTPYQISPTF